MRLRALFIYLALVVLAMLCIRAPESNERHPLLVDATVRHASESANAVPWRLYTICTPNRSNVPFLREEHSA